MMMASSNLSASAPPFTVDRSIPKSVVDLTDTAYGRNYDQSLNWLGSQPPESKPDYFSSTDVEFDSALPSSNAYRYSFVDTDLYPQGSNNLLEVNYPSYYSNASGNCSPLGIPHNSGYDLLSSSQVTTSNHSAHGDSSSHWSRLWEGSTDGHQAQPEQFDGSFYSKENYFNQGLYASEAMINFDKVSHTTDAVVGEKETVYGFRGQGVHISLVGENSKFASSVSPISASSVCTPQVPETCPPEESLKSVNSWGYQMPYGASYEEFLRKHDATPSDIPSDVNFSPANHIGPLTEHTNLFRNVNSTDADNKAFSSNSSSAFMESHPFLSSNVVTSNGDYKVFSGNNSSFFLEPDPSMISKTSVCYDGQASFCSEKNEQFTSDIPLGGNKEMSRNETVTTDAMDNGKKFRIQVPLVIPDSSSPKSGKSAWINDYSEIEDQYNPIVDSPCWRGAPVSNFLKSEASGACNPQSSKRVVAISAPNLEANPIYDRRDKDADNISIEKTSRNLMQHETWNRGSCFDPPLKTELHESDGKILHSVKQSFEATNGEKNVNDDHDEFSSQVPIHAVENVLNSPPSTGGAPISVQKLNARTLIDSMKNLSELLVFHLSSNACELKIDDYEALKDVMNNLDLCMDKTVENSGKGSTSQIHENSSNHLKESGINPPNVESPVKSQLVHEEFLSSVSTKSDEKLSRFNSEISAADKSNDDVMVQALKKALVENFDADEETDAQVTLYKNLWLEAEAALCSASCVGRFNRVKKELDNHNLKTTANENSEGKEKLSRSGEPLKPDAEGCGPLPESSILSEVAARFNILKCRIDNSNTENEGMLGYAKIFSTCASAENSAVEEKAVVEKSEMSSQHNGDDLEDLVMSRLRILNSRDDNVMEKRRVEERSEGAENRQKSDAGMVRKSGGESRVALGDGSSDWEHVLLEELAT